MKQKRPPGNSQRRVPDGLRQLLCGFGLMEKFHIYGSAFAARTAIRNEKTQTTSGFFGPISKLGHFLGTR